MREAWTDEAGVTHHPECFACRPDGCCCDLNCAAEDAALRTLTEARVSTDDGVRHDLDDVVREFGVTE